MTVFGDYAQFYDDLYQEKDYEAECDYLVEIINRFSPKPVQSILDLGCGTGGHLCSLAQRGYLVTGVDQSNHMLSTAQDKLKKIVTPNTPNLIQADLRDFQLKEKFDLVIAMFAVMGYLITNEDLLSTLQNVRQHLLPGGLFVFDAWFGPTVLLDQPTDRYKIIEKGSERIVRFAHPVLDIINQTVQVNYKIFNILDGKLTREIDEVHPMRFFFPNEIIFFLSQAGFEVIGLFPFLDLSRRLSVVDWNFTVVAQAADK